MIINKRATIKDVAKRAGVSPSTVSRVISKSNRISQSTTNLVNECMEELGYFPNAIARSLASNKSNTFGLILPSLQQDALLNPFFPEAMGGIINESSSNGYQILISSSSDELKELNDLDNMVRSSKVDGIILMTSKINDKNISYLQKKKFPFVVIGSPQDESVKFNYVDNNNFKAAYTLTEILLKSKSKSYAIITGDESLVVTKMRIEGFSKALEENGIDNTRKKIYSGPFIESTGYSYAKRLLKECDLPISVLTTDDIFAYGALRAFKEAEIKIPNQASIASFNNSFLSRESSIPITSVDVNAKALGSKAVKLLINQLSGEQKIKSLLVDYSIHKRASTQD